MSPERRAHFLTICTSNRERFLVAPECAHRVLAQFLRVATEHRFAVIAYCLMPDHLHALVESLARASDIGRFVAAFKQRSASTHRQWCGRPLWQEGCRQRALRQDEPLLSVAAFIVANPVRAGLARGIDQYPFTGSSRFSMRELRDAVQAHPGNPALRRI